MGVEIPSARIRTGQVYWLSLTLRCRAGASHKSDCESRPCKLRGVCVFVALPYAKCLSSRPVCPVYDPAYKQPKTNRWPKTSSPRIYLAPAHPAIPRSATGYGGVLRWKSTCIPMVCSRQVGVPYWDTQDGRSGCNESPRASLGSASPLSIFLPYHACLLVQCTTSSWPPLSSSPRTNSQILKVEVAMLIIGVSPGGTQTP